MEYLSGYGMVGAGHGRGSGAAPWLSTESTSEVADMRISGGTGPEVVVMRDGKFLDCVLINRLESDIADSPIRRG
jgi:hypothetical protein